MKKVLMFLLVSLFLMQSVLAINIKVNKTSDNEVLIPDLGRPVVFDLLITNNGGSGAFSFYNLLGFSMFPSGTVQINQGQTKEVELKLSPISGISQRGFYTIPYYIRGDDGSEVAQNLTFKIVDLENAFEVTTSDIDIESRSVDVILRNTENFDLGNVAVKFSSSFFNFEEKFNLGPKEIRTFTIPLNPDQFKNLTAGFYTVNAEINVDGKKTDIEGVSRFVEKDLVITTKKDFGLFVNTNIIEKKNQGNVVEKSETVIKKNIISRLFTTFSPQPDLVERNGVAIYYTWDREVRPGETLAITVKTNWLFPLLIILFLVAIVALVKQHSKTDLVLRKRVTFVKTKGGEFALKVSIFVNARRHLDRINIIDRLPALVSLYERFGGDKPNRVDHKNRRIEWNFPSLEAGDMRTLSYVIYSKVGVLGKFALPMAAAVYERDGQVHEEESNQAFFIAEQRTTDLID